MRRTLITNEGKLLEEKWENIFWKKNYEGERKKEKKERKEGRK